MADLTCKYLDIDLQSPIIVGSSNNINSIEIIKELQESQLGAIVLGSIFQEQILVNQNNLKEPSIIDEPKEYSQKALDYINLIFEAKKASLIPIIASINCYSSGDWTNYIKDLETAGADAIEFNIFFFPNDKDFRADDYEKIFLEVVTRIAHEIKIPISVKLCPYFTNLINIVDQLFYRGIQGVVIFNDCYQPDIDLDEFELIPSNQCNSNYFNQTLRWSAIISTTLQKINLSANIDKLDSDNAIKLLLAGAHSIQINSTHKKLKPKDLKQFINGISIWMDEKGFEKIEHIQGQVNYNLVKDLFQFERTELMKQLS